MLWWIRTDNDQCYNPLKAEPWLLRYSRISQVVLVYNTRSNDSRSNNAWFMHKLCKHANKDKSWYQRSRNISVICKYLFPEWRKQVWSKKLQLLKFSNENDLTKLVVDIWRNFSNRLCQLTLPEFHTFSNFTISLIF